MSDARSLVPRARLPCLWAALVTAGAALSQEVPPDRQGAPLPEEHARLLAALRESWRWRVFDRAEGLSSNTVTALYQDRDEYIYAATDLGLCRYDLHQWEVIENAEAFDGGAVREITGTQGVIYCATESALWATGGGTPLRRVFPPREPDDISSAAGRAFLASGRVDSAFLIYETAAGRKDHFQIRGRAIEVLKPFVPLPEGRVLDYEVDENDVHWLATDLGVHYRDLRERRWVELNDLDLDLPFAGAVCSRFLPFEKLEPAAETAARGGRAGSRRRVLWGVFHPRGRAADWVLARLEGFSWRELGRQTEGPSRVPVEGVLNDFDGNHYATCEDGSLFVLPARGSRWLAVNDPDKGHARLLHGGMLDAAGHLWFRLRAGGVAAFDGESGRWEPLPGIPGRGFPKVLSLLESSTGTIWAGTSDGLLRYAPAARAGAGKGGTAEWKLAEIKESVQGQPLRRITGLGEDTQGNIWISSSDNFSGAYYFDGTSWIAERGQGFGSRPIRRIVSDPQRELWFLPEQDGLAGLPVLYRRSALTGYTVERIAIEGFNRKGSFSDLARVSESEVWLASDDGLLKCRLLADRLVVSRRFGLENGLTGSRLWAVARGPDGAIWVSYWSSGRGVTRIEGDDVVSFDMGEGLPSSGVYSIVPDRHELWFGTEAGVARFDGECWYSFPVASEAARTSGVFPIVPLRPGGAERAVILGTLVHGVQVLRLDDADRPVFTRAEFPARVRAGTTAAFSWDARDYKNRTRPEELLFRYRLDGGRWSRFAPARDADLSDLSDGVHTFEVEVRDLDGNRNREKLVHRFISGSGAATWPLYLAGSIAGVVAIAAGEVLRRRAAARRREVQRYRGLFFAFPAPVFVTDANERVADYNGSSPDLAGIEGSRMDDIIGRPVYSIPALSSARAREHLRAARLQAASGRAASTTVSFDAGGSSGEKTLEISAFPLSPEGALAIVIEDRTLAQEAEALRRREERLEGLRDLAARVLEHLEQVPAVQPGAGPRASDAGDGSASGGGRPPGGEAARVVEVLRTFASRNGDEPRAVDLRDLLESAAASARQALLRHAGHAGGSGVRIDCRAQVGLWPVRAADGPLATAIRELLANAADAVAGNGEITVRANNVQLERDAGSLPPGSYVELAVEDRGRGMDPSQLERIFDPLYTTKPRDRGLGGGLSVVYGIVRRYGGDVRVQSKPARGTRVVLLLPAWRRN